MSGMIDIFTKEIRKVNLIDWSTKSGKHRKEYWDKLTEDGNGLAYCTPDGHYMIYIMAKIDYNDIVFKPSEFIYQVSSSRPVGKGTSAEDVATLKKNGFTIDEIIRLKKEGVL